MSTIEMFRKAILLLAVPAILMGDPSEPPAGKGEGTRYFVPGLGNVLLPAGFAGGVPFIEKMNGYWDTMIVNMGELHQGMDQRLHGKVGKESAKVLGKDAKGLYALKPVVDEATSTGLHDLMYYVDKMTRLYWVMDELSRIAHEAELDATELMAARLKLLLEEDVSDDVREKILKEGGD